LDGTGSESVKWRVWC